MSIERSVLESLAMITEKGANIREYSRERGQRVRSLKTPLSRAEMLFSSYNVENLIINKMLTTWNAVAAPI